MILFRETCLFPSSQGRVLSVSKRGCFRLVVGFQNVFVGDIPSELRLVWEIFFLVCADLALMLVGDTKCLVF